MNLIQCILKNSTCYKSSKYGKPVGILWHDTGAGNSNLKRYVQPHKNYDTNYNELISVIGYNKAQNDWNHTYRQAGVNAFIGKLEDGSIATIQTLPWDMQPWGCGSGAYGSCNGRGTKDSPFWIQFEICDDYGSYMPNDPVYFKSVYQEAVELTAYLCKLYNIDPNGTVNYNGVSVPTILCHRDAGNLKLGSNHGDVYVWFGKQGREKNMNQVRKDVTDILNKNNVSVQPPIQPPSQNTFYVGQQIKLVSGATYVSGKVIPDWVHKRTLYVRQVLSNGNIVFSIYSTGAITGTISPLMIEGYNEENNIQEPVQKELKVGMTFTLKPNSTYSSGKSIPDWVYKRILYVRQILSDGRIVFSIYPTGAVTGTIYKDVIII